MKICVIGGGAAGMIAAVFAARGGAETVLIEKNEKLGKKLYITGKGRCNVTNDCEPSEFFSNVVRGEKFLRSAVYGFTPADTVAFFKAIGLDLVTERGNRVFPLSQKSSDVIRALEKELTRLRVKIMLDCEVGAVKKSERGFIVCSNNLQEQFDKVIIATGGRSYPSTGSTGDGYRFASDFGLKCVETKPALAPIPTLQKVSELQGLSLKNVNLTALNCDGNILISEFGEMLFTSKGLSGPIALSVSSYINRSENVTLVLDLKPALDEETLDDRLLREFAARSNQDVKNVLRALLPDRLNAYVLTIAGIPAFKKVNSVAKGERGRLVHTLKNLKFNPAGPAQYSEAVVTSGGVDVKCLKPTMECRDVEGLYFVGETVDADALTGGFNLQIAWSTGVIAAKDAVKCLAR